MSQNDIPTLSLAERTVDQVQACLKKRIKLIYSPETIGSLIRYCYGRARDLTNDHQTRYHCGLCRKAKLVSIVLPDQFDYLYYIVYSPQKGLWLIYHQNPGLLTEPVMTTRFSRAVRYRTRGYDHLTRYLGYFEMASKKCILRPLYSVNPDKNLCRSMQKQAIDFSSASSFTRHTYDLSKGFLLVGSEGLIYFNSCDPLIFFAGLLRPFFREGELEMNREQLLKKRSEVLEILAEIVPDTVVRFLRRGDDHVVENPGFLPTACEDFIDELVEIFATISQMPEHYQALSRSHSDIPYFRLLNWFTSYYRLEPHCESRPISRVEICEYLGRCGFNFGDELTTLIKDSLIRRTEFLALFSPPFSSFQNENLRVLSQCLADL